MAESRIYEDIALRTGGDIYVGVVGPVRTGKSTFIKRFMENLIIPGIENTYVRERARDELPQSGSGRSVMTAEPKFVPEDAVSVRIDGNAELSVRLVDCVGYMVPGAVGVTEDGAERLAVVRSRDKLHSGGGGGNTPRYTRPLHHRTCDNYRRQRMRNSARGLCAR